MNNILDFESFSRILIKSGDLDPDYILINNACRGEKWSDDVKAQWLLLKSVIYRSDSELAVLLQKWSIDQVPKGSERQKHSKRAVEFHNNILAEAYRCNSYSGFFRSLPMDANEALERIKSISGFGAWAAWKLLDLGERCLGVPFDFSKIDFRFAYEYPLKGMLMVAGENEDDWQWLKKRPELYHRSLERAIGKLGEVRSMKAPPGYDRQINMQEIETLFCKYHSYLHGKYEPLEDIKRLRSRLEESSIPAVRRFRMYV